VRGVEFYQRKEIKDVLGYLQLLNNPRDSVAFRRIINTPARGIGKTTITAIDDYSIQTGESLLNAARHAGIIPGLPKRAAVAVSKFVSMYDKLRESIHEPVQDIITQVLALTNYEAGLIDSDDEDDADRLANIRELVSAANEFDLQMGSDATLEAFLEQASLTNDIDGWDTDDDRVALMTLHAAKGLEFPVVFLIAVEEGLLPHQRSIDSDADLEEERRLLFVGITRAQQELHLSTAQHRMFRGTTRYTVPSSFLAELPTIEMSVRDRTEIEYPEFDDQDHAVEDFELNVHEDDDLSFPPVVTDDNKLAPSSPETDRMSALAKLGIKTAAEMRAAASSANPSTGSPSVQSGSKLPPEAFRKGMQVEHPEYGTGQITSIDGLGVRRAATVVFPESGEKRFLLAYSTLKIVR
jgi:DNA helicase-2/ATP-dependent DNA helicase PcrA